MSIIETMTCDARARAAQWPSQVGVQWTQRSRGAPGRLNFGELMSKPHADGLEALAGLMGLRGIVALTGAGCSTESGIPDYRGPKTRKKARNPIKIDAFLGQAQSRQRYWARSTAGWPRMREAAPNAAHRSLARLEASGHLAGLVTQNVDGLHQRAGSDRVIELHGALSRVRCLGCGKIEPRDGLHDRLLRANPGRRAGAAQLAPDGDVDLVGSTRDFETLGCLKCGGVLKPDVVFFGENVPRDVHDASSALMEEARGLLIVGSSLAVYSGYRFLLSAEKRRLPVGMINLGPPHRGSELVQIHVDGKAGELLPALAQILGVSDDESL